MIESTEYLDVRYYETDQMAIVHHSNYIRYFECGRAKLMQDVGFSQTRIEEEGVMTAVAAVTAQYKSPAKYGDRLRIVTRLRELPTARILFETEIYNQNDSLLCTGTVKLGFIDSTTRRPVRCPDDLLKVLEPYFPESK